MDGWYDHMQSQQTSNTGLERALFYKYNKVWETIVCSSSLSHIRDQLHRKSVPNTMFYHNLKQLKHKSHLESVNFQISIIRPQNALSSVYTFIYQKTIIKTKKHSQLIDGKIGENVINHH